MIKFTVKEGGIAAKCSVKPIIWEACNELVQEGHALEDDFLVPVHPSDEVFFAQSEDGDVIGVLCRSVDLGSSRRVTLFYVEPSSRRSGVFRTLWKKASASSNRPLTASVAAGNEVARLALKSVGADLVSATYRTTKA